MKLLIIADSTRKDILSMFDGVSSNSKLSFIGHAPISKFANKVLLKYADYNAWNDFKGAFDLLAQTKPDKVIFVSLEHYYDVALLIASKELQIATYHLEQGVRFPKAQKQLMANELEQKGNGLTDAEIKLIWCNDNFYKCTIEKVQGGSRKILKDFFFSYFNEGPETAWFNTNSTVLVPDYYITFSKMIFEFHQERNNFNGGFKGLIEIGIPYFDNLASISRNEINSQFIYVDQPFMEEKFFGWTKEVKSAFISELLERLSPKQFLVKLHPLSDNAFWKIFKNRLTILAEDDFERQLQRTDIILGHYSTLLIPLAGLAHTTTFCFENHPHETIGNMSSYLTEAGVAEEVRTVDELIHKMERLSFLREEQKINKEKFVQDWMYKFDGKAKQRLTKILLS